MMKTISDFGTCPAFDCKCEYVSMVEAQAAEIERLRGLLVEAALSGGLEQVEDDISPYLAKKAEQ
jgi:hypothetical protein